MALAVAAGFAALGGQPSAAAAAHAGSVTAHAGRRKDNDRAFRTAGSAAVPSPEQVAYMHGGFTMFIHFGVNTFMNATFEHNCDPADVQKRTAASRCIEPTVFDPQALDTDQWVRVAADLGAYAAVLTVKHEGEMF
eukprot:SAG31_NODE_2248_length_6093_cov_4.382716_3_plen_136_part_00